MTKTIRHITAYILLCVFPTFGWAQLAADTAGGVIGRESEAQRSKEMESRLRMQRTKLTQESAPAEEDRGPKVVIKDIQVEGPQVFKAQDLEPIVAPYRGKDLSLSEMQKIADEITAFYRIKGYVTSRAYIPPQNLKNGGLTIKVIEGRMGELDVKDNRYFHDRVYKQYLKLDSQALFDYPELQKSLNSINEHPDRKVRAILVPGRETGKTDVILEVEERLPVHVGFEFDNWASRYLNKYRYAMTLEHNNLTGHDDRGLFKFQTSDGINLKLYQGRYLYPLSRRANVGVYGLWTKTELSRELKDLDAHGRGYIAGVFYTYELLKEHDVEIHGNLGFDYKEIRNFSLSSQTSRDRLSVFKVGIDLDILDEWGRNIILAELDMGAPDTFGSMRAKDSRSSRLGAGGEFQKGVFTYYRLHPMPLESHILLKNTAQVSNHSLASIEQFQIGGATSVRGYAPGEFSGDKGIYSSVEWSFPIYGLSKNLQVPWRKTSFYDALRLVAFYDIGFVNTKRAVAGERENNTLKGYGFGIRFNPDPDMEVRFEAGVPIGRRSADGNRTHFWIEAKFKF